MKAIVIMLATMTMLSCSQQSKTSSEAEANKEEQSTETQLGSDALKIGVIQKNKDGRSACPYTIRLKEVSYLLDPTDLAEEFMEDGLKVRFDYLPLRMKNRCKEANPVKIISMVKM